MENSGIKCNFIIDGYHLRAGFEKEYGKWPTTDELSSIISNIVEGVSHKIHEITGISFILNSWIYCDALLSHKDESSIKAYVEKQNNLPEDKAKDIEFDLNRYINARTVFSTPSNKSFKDTANAIITDLEVGKSDWIRFPPRQTGVDTIIATEMMITPEEHQVLIIVSKDGGFSYTVKRLSETCPDLAVFNLNYEPDNYGKVLRHSCSGYFTADKAGEIVDAFAKENIKFVAGEFTPEARQPDEH